MSVPRYLTLYEASKLLGGKQWLVEFLEAIDQGELKAHRHDREIPTETIVATDDLRHYMITHHGADPLEQPVDAHPQATPIPTDNTLLATIAALIAVWPSGKFPSGKELEKAAASVSVAITDDSIRNALKAARAIAKGLPPA